MDHESHGSVTASTGGLNGYFQASPDVPLGTDLTWYGILETTRGETPAMWPSEADLFVLDAGGAVVGGDPADTFGTDLQGMSEVTVGLSDPGSYTLAFSLTGDSDAITASVPVEVAAIDGVGMSLDLLVPEGGMATSDGIQVFEALPDFQGFQLLSQGTAVRGDGDVSFPADWGETMGIHEIVADGIIQMWSRDLDRMHGQSYDFTLVDGTVLSSPTFTVRRLAELDANWSLSVDVQDGRMWFGLTDPAGVAVHVADSSTSLTGSGLGEVSGVYSPYVDGQDDYGRGCGWSFELGSSETHTVTVCTGEGALCTDVELSGSVVAPPPEDCQPL